MRQLQLCLGETRLQVEEAFFHTLHASGARVGAAASAAHASSGGAAAAGAARGAQPRGASAGAGASPAAPADESERLDLLMSDAAADLPPILSSRKRPWYLDALQLNEARLVLSYRKLPSRGAPLSGPSRSGGLRLPASLPNFDALPLNLRGFERRHLFLERSR